MSVATPSASPRLWSIIPAAGSSRRFGGELPKQYERIGGLTVLEHSVSRLLAIEDMSAVVVATAADDARWRKLPVFSDPRVFVVNGGAERADSVMSALQMLSLRDAAAHDWVLVHDAARPCVSSTDIRRLLKSLMNHPVGGLLAIPLSDTLKRADSSHTVEATLERRDLWCAQTPQMFRFAPLHNALRDCQRQGLTVTDEASAVEAQGQRPQLVLGSPRNIKITRPADLDIARLFMESS